MTNAPAPDQGLTERPDLRPDVAPRGHLVEAFFGGLFFCPIARLLLPIRYGDPWLSAAAVAFVIAALIELTSATPTTLVPARIPIMNFVVALVGGLLISFVPLFLLRGP